MHYPTAEYEYLEQKDWSGFFEVISRQLEINNIEIKLSSLEASTEWTRLLNLSFESRDNAVKILFGENVHSVLMAKQIILTYGEDHHLMSIVMQDSDGRLQTMAFKHPLFLNFPSGARVTLNPIEQTI